jgi:thiosulfate reductase cytochrome b subunit
MKDSTRRTILRWIHIIFGLTLIGFIYGPPAETEQYRDNFRFIFLPVVLLTGLWMWKGHIVSRLFSKKSAQPGADQSAR